MAYTLRDLLNMLKSNSELSIEGAHTFEITTPTHVYTVKLSEHDLQAAVIQECDRRALVNPLWGLVLAIPNGGQRSKAQGGKLKAEGVRAGVPDLFLPVARHGYHGLFLELKVGDNELSKMQQVMIDRLEGEGYYCVVIWDKVEVALDEIEWYLEGK